LPVPRGDAIARPVADVTINGVDEAPFDRIHVSIDGYLEVVDLEPHDDRLQRLGLGSDGNPP
jgi:hypothetical protein